MVLHRYVPSKSYQCNITELFISWKITQVPEQRQFGISNALTTPTTSPPPSLHKNGKMGNSIHDQLSRKSKRNMRVQSPYVSPNVPLLARLLCPPNDEHNCWRTEWEGKIALVRQLVHGAVDAGVRTPFRIHGFTFQNMCKGNLFQFATNWSPS